jgi:hypothetical protein
MTIEELANSAIDLCESLDAEYMVTGALAFNFYGIPRSTKDVDLVIDVSNPSALSSIIKGLEPAISFGGQVQFDTITWGKRHIGRPVGTTALSIELFELFDDPFVMSQFKRRVQIPSAQLNRKMHIPTAEDVVVQKLRWARPKDLEDARDVLAVQDPARLDMAHVEKWCTEHGTIERLKDILESLPEF